MAVFVQTARNLVAAYLALLDDVTYATSSDGEKTAALAAINAGYRRYLIGDYVDEIGTKQTHIWSCARHLAQITLRAGDEDYDLPDAYEGNIEPFIYDYNALVNHKELNLVTHDEILRLRRDDNTEGQPTDYTVRAKAYSATAGSVYEWICYPKPESATVTQAGTAVTRVTGPAFHAAMVDTTIEITGETDGNVESVTDADTLVSDQDQTVAAATEAHYDNGLTIRYRYRVALAALTDVATSIPGGLIGCGDLIVQAARMLDEHDTGGVDGTETARFYRMMGEMVRRDKAVIPANQNLQRHIRQ